MDHTSSFVRPLDGVNEDRGFRDSGSDISSTVFLDDEENKSEVLSMLSMDENSLPSEVTRQELDDNGLSSLESGPNVSDASSLPVGLETNSETATPFIDAETLVDPVPSVGNGEDIVDDLNSRSSMDVVVLDARPNGRSSRSIFEVSYVPVWGLTSICGGRSDMEDAVSVIPNFVEIPLHMLVDRPPDRLPSHITHLSAHFFGVFDGHGGFEVSSYCRDRAHSALSEELEAVTTTLNNGNSDSCEEMWRRAFTKCFHKVDDEIVGFARDNIGSTAVVALVFTSHIVVANCGDSRAVLCRGREAIALSVDHKPSRQDELARIESAGGRVFEWGGLRISGILAMSRSIGDRYLKPAVISDPEVMVVPRSRDDECLILASDGLWDVVANEEACEIARRSIQLWYRNNGAMERAEGVDPASQAAASALSSRALRRGSRDNISVIVLDLKHHRKSRSKPTRNMNESKGKS